MGLAGFRIREHLLDMTVKHAGTRRRGRPFLLAVKDVVLAVVAQYAFGLLSSRVAPTLGSREAKGGEPCPLARWAANAFLFVRFRTTPGPCSRWTGGRTPPYLQSHLH